MKRNLTGLRMGAGASLALTAVFGLVSACNQHPVSYSSSVGSVEEIMKTPVDGAQKLDMLWVVDNSGSMCQEQKALRENFDTFVNELQKTNLNFHIGVTTTDMNGEYMLEPVAEPGHLQSTPQPVPGFDPSCHTAVDAAGQAIPGDYGPIKAAIAAAVACMANPDNSYLDPSNADIECALYGTPMGCEIARVGCGGTDPCSSEDLFPPTGSYRAIPKVLRSADYTEGGVLDVDRLRADFGCMAFVGTRGYGIEKGLSAAVTAVSPDLTGGAVDADGANTGAANHGLIRDNARFALVFVTDENDCSHDGTLDEATPCGGDVCEFANSVDVSEADSPLLAPSELKTQLVENLRATKGDENFTDADILIASIHGNFKRFDGEVPTNAECGAEGYPGISTSCATKLGVAYSGDRYDRFLREFSQYYPAPNPADPDAPLTGWMCQGDFRPALTAIGEFFTSASSGCITNPIYPCTSDDQCPAFPFGEGAGSCVARPNSDQKYCDSAIQVRAVASNDSDFQHLQDSGYCIPDSIGSVGLEMGCVISGDKFGFDACPGETVSGIRLSWSNSQEARNALLGSDLQVRYNSIPAP